MNTTASSQSKTAMPPGSATLLDAAKAACKRIAPLWPLQNFVAVNPFVGISEIPFLDACDLVGRVAPGGMQMPLEFYAQKLAAGEILDTDL